MPNNCPQDGGFIGSSGCTHPNHNHSELVKHIISGAPKIISTKDAESALKEGFYVKNPEGKEVGFGEKLLTHLEAHHLKGDSDARKTRLMFAVKTVSNPDKVEKNHRNLEGRTLYSKSFENFGIIAISEKGNDTVEQIFTIVPKRKGKK